MLKNSCVPYWSVSKLWIYEVLAPPPPWFTFSSSERIGFPFFSFSLSVFICCTSVLTYCDFRQRSNKQMVWIDPSYEKVTNLLGQKVSSLVLNAPQGVSKQFKNMSKKGVIQWFIWYMIYVTDLYSKTWSKSRFCFQFSSRGGSFSCQ